MSSMMEMMGAPPMDPGAGAPPPSPDAGGDPLAALLGGGGAPPPEEAPMEPPVEEGDETSDYQEAKAALERALSRPTTDEQEMAKIQKCITAIQDLLAANEKMVDQTLGTSPNLRKALAGGAGPTY